jgi:predicted DNA-binding protein YlxM (UPF0122 family)
MVDKILEISLLYDFYGSLLTNKQKDVIELYYGDDLSLGEISETIDISRQGVYDILKRSEKQLYYYEDKLKLVERFMEQKKKIKKAYELLDSLGKSDKIDSIKKLLSEVL